MGRVEPNSARRRLHPLGAALSPRGASHRRVGVLESLLKPFFVGEKCRQGCGVKLGASVTKRRLTPSRISVSIALAASTRSAAAVVAWMSRCVRQDVTRTSMMRWGHPDVLLEGLALSAFMLVMHPTSTRLDIVDEFLENQSIINQSINQSPMNQSSINH